MAIYLARNYSLKFLCIRQFQNRIADSVYTVLVQKIEQAGWGGEFEIANSTIRHVATGSEFLFYGMARNMAEIKGIEGVDICWIEEGEGLLPTQWAIIDPTIRKEGAEIWLLWNPRSSTDFIESELPKILGDDLLVKHINYDQNPFLSDSARAKAERLKATDYDEYCHIYLGQPRSDDDAAIIRASWIKSAIDAFETLKDSGEGMRISALDVADEGKDMCAQSLVDGIILRDISMWTGRNIDIHETTRRAIDSTATFGSRSLRYDADGLGAGCRGAARVINAEREESGLTEIDISAFHGGGEVIDKQKFFIEPTRDMPGVTNGQYFANRKGQGWWSLAERFRKTFEHQQLGVDYDVSELILIDPKCSNIEQLTKELCQVRRKKSTKYAIDKAPDGTASPNLADAVMMAYSPAESRPTVFFA